MRRARRAAAIVLALAAAVPVCAQGPGTATVRVLETAGIRRTTFPVTARVDVPQGALSDLSRVRLREANSDVPAQFGSAARWPDGSIAALTIDVNVSIDALQSRTFVLEYGDGVPPGPVPGGLAVDEEADGVRVGSLRFSRSGTPLVLSADYRNEARIGPGFNGLVLVDRTGARHDLSSATGLEMRVLASGPVHVAIEYTGRLSLGPSVSVPFVLTIDVPSSKAWFKATADLDDPTRAVRGVFFEFPYALGAHPWTWDVGTANGTYGIVRDPEGGMRFTQTVEAGGGGAWQVETGAEGARLAYERSIPGRASIASGWAHFQGARHVVAVAVEDFGRQPGEYLMRLGGEGRASFGFVPAGPSARHHFAVYQHFVLAPVAIGAATSPAAILNPLVVELVRP